MSEEYYTDEDKADQFGRYAHDTQCLNHSRKRGHYCLEFDGLWICEDCSAFECCTCFDEPEQCNGLRLECHTVISGNGGIKAPTCPICVNNPKQNKKAWIEGVIDKVLGLMPGEGR